MIHIGPQRVTPPGALFIQNFSTLWTSKFGYVLSTQTLQYLSLVSIQPRGNPLQVYGQTLSCGYCAFQNSCPGVRGTGNGRWPKVLR